MVLQLVSFFISFRTSAGRSLGIVIMLPVAKPSTYTFAACFSVYVFPSPSITVYPLCVVTFSSFSDFVSFQSFVESFLSSSGLLEFFLLEDSLTFVVLCDLAVCGVIFHLLTSLTCSVVSSFKCLLQNGW